MERKPEHIHEDPSLRAEYINQVSFDEYLASSWPFMLNPDADQFIEYVSEKYGFDLSYESLMSVLKKEWYKTIHPKTLYSEVLYLEGMVTQAERLHAMDQWHTDFVKFATELGLVDERPKDQDFRKMFGE